MQGEFLESLRSERHVADVKHDSFEAFTKSQLNDMSGCIQDKVEHRLSELHRTVHTQSRRSMGASTS